MAALRALDGLFTNGRGHGAAETRNGHVNGNGNANGNGHQADVWDELRREIERCRRYGRSFALVKIARVAGHSLSGTFRAIDRDWVADGATFVLLPESARATAEALVARLRSEAPDLVDGAAVSVAAFPEDGITSGALLKALRAAPEPAAAPSMSRVRVADAPPVHA